MSAHRLQAVALGIVLAVLAGACQPTAGVFVPPSLDAIPNDERGAKIRFGYQLVVNTQEHARAYVGNALNCGSCHLEAGRKLHAAPYVGLASVYKVRLSPRFP